MILSCNSCGKKFIVPDNAIGASGRLVQCSSCGNKWKQFPIKQKIEKPSVKKAEIKKVKKIPKKIKKKTKKTGPDLYSPEYLAKKHGIRIGENNSEKKISSKKEKRVSFGFYNFFIVFIVFIIFAFRMIYFTQDFITNQIPSLETYINYTFENLKNIKDIILNLL